MRDETVGYGVQELYLTPMSPNDIIDNRKA